MNEGTNRDQGLRCFANGCPLRWTVQSGKGRGLCSVHAGAAPEAWPALTERLIAGEDLGPGHDCLAHDVAEQLGAVPKGPLAWAHRLRILEEAGRPITLWQRKAWREALGTQR